jgi:hypothetical protein
MLDPAHAPGTIVAKSGSSAMSRGLAPGPNLPAFIHSSLPHGEPAIGLHTPVHSTVEHLHFLEMRDGRG